MKIHEDVLEFHRRFLQPAPDAPTLLDEEVTALRTRLIEEECRELKEALASGDLAQIAGEGMDVIYAVLGTLVSAGLDPSPFWDAVHGANMAKEPNPRGPMHKPIKPEGWEKPDLDEILARQSR